MGFLVIDRLARRFFRNIRSTCPFGPMKVSHSLPVFPSQEDESDEPFKEWNLFRSDTCLFRSEICLYAPYCTHVFMNTERETSLFCPQLLLCFKIIFSWNKHSTSLLYGINHTSDAFGVVYPVFVFSFVNTLQFSAKSNLSNVSAHLFSWPSQMIPFFPFDVLLNMLCLDCNLHASVVLLIINVPTNRTAIERLTAVYLNQFGVDINIWTHYTTGIPRVSEQSRCLVNLRTPLTSKS